jgi:hypothetical protein
MMVRALAVVLVLAPAAGAGDEPQRFEFPEGGYSAVFPRKPKAESKEVRTAAGDLKVYVWSAAGGNDLTLSVTYTDYPPKFADLDRDRLLEAVRNGLKTKDARFVADVAVEADGRRPAGREVHLNHGKYHTRTRLFLVGSRLYQVTATGAEKAVLGKAAEQFLRSFEPLK